MDHQFIFNALIGVAVAVSGWLGRQVWDAVQKLKEDVRQIELDIPNHYVKKDEFTQVVKELKDMLTRIFDKLDDKQDKR
jgi:hypothetical protein